MIITTTTSNFISVGTSTFFFNNVSRTRFLVSVGEPFFHLSYTASSLSTATSHRTKNQVSVNLNMVETRDSVAETQRQTRVSVSGYITVCHVSVAAFSTEPEHFFTCFRQISVSRITYFRKRLRVLMLRKRDIPYRKPVISFVLLAET